MRYLALIVLIGLCWPCRLRADTSGLTIEDLAINLLASTNSNVGLAEELYKTGDEHSRTVLDAIKQAEDSAKNGVLSLRTWRENSSNQGQVVSPAAFGQMTTGLMSVVKQSRALRRWVRSHDDMSLVEYHQERVRSLRALEELSRLTKRKIEAPAP
ncbi:MAG TPA: hypothetical protein VG713_01885 [Pirellulales bacterium]|nr:hypothetical protein [Pirellulales bacterium]